MQTETGLEQKFCRFDAALTVDEAWMIEGYASRFGTPDQGGDTVVPGAFAASLRRLADEGRQVKMLWQHDPAQPIGVWTEVREDASGLYVQGHLLESVPRAREAAALIRAGAIDGLSIGYRTLRAKKADAGSRLLTELELWEVSLVTFPMLPAARLGAKDDALDAPDASALRDLARAFDAARQELARM